MRDLYRCLDEYSPQLLDALAEVWGVSLPRAETLEMVRALGDAMLAPGAVDKVVAGLSVQARLALAEIIAEGGAVPAQHLFLRYGPLRRFGPARLMRERPWLLPEGAVEELYYRGLLFRAYGEAGATLGDLLIIPDQLLPRIPPLKAPPPEWEQPLGTAPNAVRGAGGALCEDLFTLLVTLRRRPVPARPDDEGGLSISGIESIVEHPRWRGETDPARKQLVVRLAHLLRLLTINRGLVEPGTTVRDWLSLPDATRMTSTLAAWRDDPHLHELSSLPGIRCEGTGSSSAAETRKNLLEILARFHPHTWYALSAFAAALKRVRPDYLRAEGEPGWFIRDLASAAYLEGPDTWDRVEGALAVGILVGPLYWLGALELGLASEDGAPMAFRVAPWLVDAAGAEAHIRPLPRPGGRSRPARTAPPAQCDEALTIRISTIDSQYERYQLERLARWQGLEADTAVYRLNEESLWEAHERGIRLPQIIAFLTRLCGSPLPPDALGTLQEWGAHLGKATLTHAVVLQVADEPTMRRIRADQLAAATLGEALSPLACVVIEGRLEDLVTRLKVMGIWPHMRLEP